MRKLRRSRKFKLLLGLCLVLSAVLLVNSGAHALSRRYFDDTSNECDLLNQYGAENAALCNNTSKTVRLTVGQTTNVPVTKDVLRAYYQLPHNPDGSLKPFLKDGDGHSEVTLTVIHADFCPTYPTGAAGNIPPVVGDGTAVDQVNNGYFAQRYLNSGYTLPTQTPVTAYEIGKVTGNTVNYTVEKDGVYRADGNCGASRNITFYLTTGEFSPVDGQPGVYYVQFRATYISPPPQNSDTGPKSACVKTPNNTNCDGIMNSFSLTEGDGTNASEGYYIIANASPNDPDAPNGYGATIREQDDSNPDPTGTGSNQAFRIPFGADCTVTSANTDADVPLWDLDGTDIRLALKRAPDTDANAKTGATDWSWWTGNNWSNDPTKKPSASNWSAQVSTYAAGPPAAYRVDPPPGGDTTLYWRFTADPGYYYVLYILNVNPILEQQYSTPYDGIYFMQPCPPPNTPGVDCSISITPLAPDYKMPLSVDVQGNAYNFVSGSPPNRWTVVMNGTTWTSNTAASSVDHVFSVGAQPIGDFSASATITATNSTTGQTATDDCGIDVTVGTMPYLSVWGGDALAGGYAQAGATSCSVDSNAGFDSWNNDGSPDYSGAGGQVGVAARGPISNFSSALNGGSGIPYLLSLANTTNTDFSGDYGGSYGATVADCDFGSPSDATNTSIANGFNASIGDSQHKFYYITGSNVYISGNVAYTNDSTGWAKLSIIPSFKLVVVGGNIYIGNTVARLDGVYVAEPNSSGNGGTIYTCASGLGSPYGTGDTTHCNHQLSVYGTFAAQNIVFGRTSGTLGSASTGDTYIVNSAAENFIRSPIDWLPNSSGGNYTIDSFQGLPPIL